ncbi:MAG: histidine phosphatase family protein [Nanoarchaeota archaeon]
MKKRHNFYIYLFRHGQTYFNKKHIFTGWMDSKLTPLGKRQARVVARKLKNKKIGIAIQTRLSRSKKSLQEVLQFHPECRRVIIDNRMIERAYGNLEGLHHDSIIKKYGQQQFDLWHRDYKIRPPGGESFADVEKRVRSFLADLKKLIKKEKTTVVISAHGNSIRMFRKIMEHATIEKTTSWTIPYTKVFVYKIVI